jgi:hypothetical protein
MKALALITTLLAAIGASALAAEPPLTIAVFDFQSPDAASGEIGAKLAALVSVQLSTDERFITVERQELDKALGEQELALSGTVSADSAAKVGNLTGAKALVTGRIIKNGAETLVVAKVIGTETSRVFGVSSKLPAEGASIEAASALAKSIGDVAAKNAGVLLAKVEAPGARLERIKAALPAAEKRATVLVKIPEQHFGRPVIDPAAETEIAKILQECGFTVLDDKSPGRPDFAIEGEAFSERALQRGNLVSCKARVEIKLRNVSTGAIVSSDRQVSVAADLGEHIAAKSALALAAAEMAERLVPKLR